MKKRSVTKFLSYVLAISMVITAAPMAAWASEVPVAVEEASEEAPEDVEEEKQEDTQDTTDVEDQETPQQTEGISEDAPEAESDVQAEGEAQDQAPEVMAAEEQTPAPPEPGITTRAIPVDGVSDDWQQDPETVIGNDSEIIKDKFLQLKAGTGNGNSASNKAQYPAMFVNPNTFDFTKEGFFEFDVWPMTDKTATRFGVYLDYKGPGEGMFLGYDADGWFWQKYSNGGNGPWYTGGRVEAPVKAKWTTVRISWTGNGEFSLEVGGIKVFQNEPSGLTHGSEGKIAFKCAGFNGTATHVYLGSIYYTGQEMAEGWHVTGTVKDEEGNPISGATVSAGRSRAETGADGTYDLEVFDGAYDITVSKAGYADATTEVEVEGADVVADDIVLVSREVTEKETLQTDAMSVQVARNFPSIVQYDMKGALNGKTFYGQPDRINTVKINGVSIALTKEDVKPTFTDKTATYEMTLKGENVDCVITAVISVEGNTASFDITKVENHLTDVDENGYAVYPIQTIEIPNHSLISVNSTQENAHLKGAKMSSNTRISGDRDFDVTEGMKLTNGASNEDFIYGFISNNEMSAGLWSNSEYEGTHVASYISAGGASNTRVMATVSEDGDKTSVGLGSTQWYYDRKVTTNVVVDRVAENGQNKNTTEERTYVVGHEIMPSAKVAIAGDENGDGDIDWQDGAVAFRSIMHNPYKSEEVPELVNYRIAMNFGSMAANPFLMNLDGVKRVYLNTEGLGQGVLLKGYGSEGHDSGHPDYGDIGRRIGGAEDMNKLLVEGKKMGALFGVHVNASEMYPEAKAFSNELSQGNFGWNWIDQGIGINSRYDLATGAREQRFKDLYNQVGNNLDFIYVDVWGNLTSGGGNEDSWATRMLFREISGLGWRVATEWGPTGEYDSTLQHWAADLAYGGNQAKGENSEVMRFLRNHQKDSWIADYPSYGGAAQAPLLGGLNMTDFEGWQGRTDYKNYINIMFRHNLITKYLQHYQVVDWEDGDAVTLGSGETWIPEMKITLKNTKDKTDDTEVIATRKSNNYTDLANYRSRTITLNGVTISEGAPTGGDGSNPGDEKYLIPWNWDCNGNKLAADDLKMYHWNTQGGTSTWTLTKDWEGLSNVVVYKLTDQGRTDKKVVNVVNNTITLEDMEAEIPYVVFKGEKAPLAVDWQTSKYVYDMGFNDPDINSHRTVSGTGTATIADNAKANHMLKLEGEVSVSTKLTKLKKGQKYALYVGMDNRSDSKAHVTVSYGGKVLGTNYGERSYAYNYVKSDQHNKNSHTEVTENGGTYSYFQNMYVFFTAESGTATLTFKREAGEGATYFDDIRVVETKMDVAEEVDEDGIITSLYNDFEENAQGIWPFVVSGAEGVEDNRIHLSERHDPYSQAGYISKNLDDVLDGNWSLKVNGLSQRNSLIYQTVPQNFHFQPGETYNVSFDYQMGSDGVYEVRLGDGSDQDVERWSLAGAAGDTKRFSFTFTAGQSGQNWIGIYSTTKAPTTGGYTGQMLDFSGYKDFILDNLRIEKAKMTIDKTYTEVSSADQKISLNVDFVDGVDPNTAIKWTSSDESVARVNGDGEVYMVDFGSAMITATAQIDGKEVSLCSTVYFPEGTMKTATFTDVWANTEEAEGEDGRAVNVTDRASGTIWHSNWAGAGFTVSESNPAIITVKFEEDISEFDSVRFQQRSGSNGLVQKYECIVGSSFNEEDHTIGETGKFTTGVVTARNSGSGQIEALDLPEDTKGNYLQIRVLQGAGNFASIADILIDSEISYDTPEQRQAMQDNAEKAEQQKEEADVKQGELKEALKEAEDILAGGESLYSAESWAAFEAAYRTAAAVEASGTTSLTKLEETKTALAAAQKNLVELTETDKQLEVSVKELKAAIAEAKPIYDGGQNAYSNASWEAFKKAYDAAKAGENSKDPAAVNKLKTDLISSQGALKELNAAEKQLENARQALRDAIAQAKTVYDKGQGKYSNASWEAFEDAYTAAAAGVNSESSSKLSRLQKNLITAQDNLKEAEKPEPSEEEKQLAAAKDAVKAAVAAAKDVYEAGKKNYTTASWEAFEEAYIEAKAGQNSNSKSKLKRLAATLTAAQGSLKQNAPAPALKVGDTVTVKNVRYKVTSVSKKTVAVTGGKSKNITAAPIASTVKVKGVTCKVTTINAKAFKGYKKLKKVVIGANVTSIKSEAFAGCTSLAQVSIGKKVTTIDKKAFYGCKKLKKVVFLGTAVKSIKTGAFKNTSASMKVTLPKSTSASKRTSMKKMLTKAGMNKKATVK